ncbi:MAG: hypothetical protein QOH25_2446 [Acidobacteriota bacterium]|jgi:hypothetical protein|nr:hypothetical protein [Acidobacteriota bacterium]
MCVTPPHKKDYQPLTFSRYIKILKITFSYGLPLGPNILFFWTPVFSIITQQRCDKNIVWHFAEEKRTDERRFAKQL